MQIISDKNCKCHVIAVSVSKSLNDPVNYSHGHLRDCTQGAWPLSQTKKTLVEKLLAKDKPVFVVPYCTERTPGCPLEDCRVVKGVFRLDYFEGFKESEKTFGRGNQKRTLFMLNEVKPGECDIRAGECLHIDRYITNYPYLMGPWKKKNK